MIRSGFDYYWNRTIKEPMKKRIYTKTNNRTGNQVETRVTKYSDGTTNVRRTLKKSDGLFGTRFLGSEKTLSDKTFRSR